MARGLNRIRCMPFPLIAALQPSVSVTLAGLGKLDHLAACTKWCVEQVPGLAERGLPILPDSWYAAGPDVATLHELRIDLVLASVPYQQASLAALIKTGTPVLALAPHSLQDIYADTRLIASLVNARAEAEAMIEEFQQALAEVASRASETSVAIHCEEWSNPIIHSQQWVNELVADAGGRPVGQSGAHSTPGEVAAANPDALILAWCGAGDRVPLRRVVEMRNWSGLPAVQQRRMYCVPDELLNTPALPSLREGLACVAHCVCPQTFSAPVRLRRL